MIIRVFLNWILKIFSLFTPFKRKRKIFLRDLAEAMARFEGFYSSDSRARRNHNPLNLKESPFRVGKDKDGFCIFKNNRIGWAAGLWDLSQKKKGNTRTGLGPNSTIKDLIYIWTEDHKEEYLFYVIQRLGIDRNFRLKNFIE